MSFQTEKLGSHMAAAVSGLDLNHLPDPATRASLLANWRTDRGGNSAGLVLEARDSDSAHGLPDREPPARS